MFVQRRTLIVEECDVTTVLQVINHNQNRLFDALIGVGHCGWADDLTKWYIHFQVSDKRWGNIACDLVKIGQIGIKVNPAGAAEMHFTRN